MENQISIRNACTTLACYHRRQSGRRWAGRDRCEEWAMSEDQTPLRTPPLPPWHTPPQDHPMAESVSVLTREISRLLAGSGLRVWKAHGADGRVRFSFALTFGVNREPFVALFVAPVDNGRRFLLQCEWIGAPRNYPEYGAIMQM